MHIFNLVLEFFPLVNLPPKVKNPRLENCCCSHGQRSHGVLSRPQKRGCRGVFAVAVAKARLTVNGQAFCSSAVRADRVYYALPCFRFVSHVICPPPSQVQVLYY